jgi:hypothetical protein
LSCCCGGVAEEIVQRIGGRCGFRSGCGFGGRCGIRSWCGFALGCGTVVGRHLGLGRSGRCITKEITQRIGGWSWSCGRFGRRGGSRRFCRRITKEIVQRIGRWCRRGGWSRSWSGLCRCRVVRRHGRFGWCSRRITEQVV